MFLFSIYPWEPCPPFLLLSVHLFLVWINWKHVSTTDKYQRRQATRLLMILELLLFYFSFWTEDKRGLNKHGEPTAAPLPMEGHIFLVFHGGGDSHRKEKLFEMNLIPLSSITSENMLPVWHKTCHVCVSCDGKKKKKAQMDPARSDWYRRNVILYSADGCHGCIIMITCKVVEHI